MSFPNRSVTLGIREIICKAIEFSARYIARLENKVPFSQYKIQRLLSMRNNLNIYDIEKLLYNRRR